MKTLFLFLAFTTYALAADSDDLQKEKQLSADYLTKMAAEVGAETLSDGVIIRPLFKAEREQFPLVTDTVEVSYFLTDREGKLIEESLSGDEILAFPLPKLIRCWQIALPKMSVGSFYKVSCPSDTAYGDKGTSDGSIKGGAALTFRINLYGIAKASSGAAQ